MSKVKLTKQELKRQKESLKRFRRYLPTLQLKKKQLQLEIIRIRRSKEDLLKDTERYRQEVSKWVDVFSEEIRIEEILKVKPVRIKEGNVAGISLPLFEGIDFEIKDYDLLTTPLWVDKGIEALKKVITFNAKLEILKKQEKILSEELRIANQRVNLFEKVKIPESRESIRIIQIYVGELRTAEVVRGKIAKKKIESRRKNIYS